MSANKQLGLKDAKTMWDDSKLLKRLVPVVDNHKIVAKKTALLVLDMNYVCAHRDYGVGPRLNLIGLSDDYYNRIDNGVIPNIQRLLSFFRKNNRNIVYTTMGCEQEDMSDLPETWRKIYTLIGYNESRPGTKEFEIREEVKPLSSEPVLLKKSFGAFSSCDLHGTLQKMGVDTLVIVGVETDCCLYATAMEANDRGYKVIVLDDACTTATMTGHRLMLHTYGRLFFFNVKTTDELLEKLHKIKDQKE